MGHPVGVRVHLSERIPRLPTGPKIEKTRLYYVLHPSHNKKNWEERTEKCDTSSPPPKKKKWQKSFFLIPSSSALKKSLIGLPLLPEKCTVGLLKWH